MRAASSLGLAVLSAFPTVCVCVCGGGGGGEPREQELLLA